jgi:hypothetical protein
MQFRDVPATRLARQLDVPGDGDLRSDFLGAPGAEHEDPIAVHVQSWQRAMVDQVNTHDVHRLPGALLVSTR